MKTLIWDILFMIILGIILSILEYTGNLAILFRLPYMTILVSYFIGRFVGEVSNRKNNNKEKSNM